MYVYICIHTYVGEQACRFSDASARSFSGYLCVNKKCSMAAALMHANSIHRATLCSSCCMLLPRVQCRMSKGRWQRALSGLPVPGNLVVLELCARGKLYVAPSCPGQAVSIFAQLFINFKHLETS